MSRSLKIALAAGATLALATAAQAQQDADTAGAFETTMASQVVVRDPATGRLRAPTAEEFAALQPRVETVRVPGRTLQRTHASGAKGLRLNDSFMSFQVYLPQADGTMKMVCFESREEAEAALKSMPIVATQNLPTE